MAVRNCSPEEVRDVYEELFISLAEQPELQMEVLL